MTLNGASLLSSGSLSPVGTMKSEEYTHPSAHNILRDRATDQHTNRSAEFLEQVQERMEKAAARGEHLLSQMLMVFAEHQAATKQLVAEQNHMLKALFEAGLKAQPSQLSVDSVQPSPAVKSVSQESEHKTAEPVAHFSNNSSGTSGISTLPATLKVSMNGEVHRVKLPADSSKDLTYTHVFDALKQTVPEVGNIYVPKYRDHAGDLCSLTPNSFSDFLEFASNEVGEQVLKIDVCYAQSEAKGAQPRSSRGRTGKSQREVPSVIRSWFDIFTMGFAIDRFRILEEFGPAEVMNRMKEEASNLALLATLCLTVVFELWEALVSGGFDPVFLRDADGNEVQHSWPYYTYYLILNLSLGLLSIAVASNVLMSLMISNLIDDDAAEFIQDSGVWLKVPYLASLYGVLALLAAVMFVSFFPLSIHIVSGIISNVWFVFAALVATIAGAKYIRATYAADSKDVEGDCNQE